MISYKSTRGDENYVLIIADNGKCWSDLGMRSVGHNNMSLLPSCVQYHLTVLHEFLHAFGVFHTHQRQDRDDYITVNWDDIQSDWKYWYQKKQNS